MIYIPKNLREYITYGGEGTLEILKPIPENLKKEYENFKKFWDKCHDHENFTDY